jgi:hypothetical protein
VNSHGFGRLPRRLAVASGETAREDEELAAAARAWYRRHQLREITGDERDAAPLAPDERLFAVRHHAVAVVTGGSCVVEGTLYLTSHRLVIGAGDLSIALTELAEAGLAGERLVVVLVDGGAIVVDVERPRLLRVEIATARAAARIDAAASVPVGRPQPGSR